MPSAYEIQARILDFLATEGLTDPDGFAARAAALYRRERARQAESLIAQSVRALKTDAFATRRRERAELTTELVRVLDSRFLAELEDATVGQTTDRNVYDLVAGLEVLRLSRYSVVGDYMRFDEVARSALMDAKQRITAGLESRGRTRENHLIWAAPGSGKTYFVEQVAAALPSSFGFLELNLAKHDQERFSADLRGVEQTEEAHLCFVDEIDAKPQEAWPYEILLPYLDAAVERGTPLVFVLAGSGGESIEALKSRIGGRPKGTDLLSRIPSVNECAIAPLSVLDRVLVALSQIRQLGREAGRDIRGVEKLGLCYIALSPDLTNARQLREFAARAVERVPAGEDRVKYDDLFSAGDPENKGFWVQAGPAADELASRFVTLED